MPRAPSPPARPGPVPVDAGRLSGHRHARRRAASALVRRDAVPRTDPLRAHGRAGVAGVLLAALALGAAAVSGLVARPADWRSAAVVVGEDSGALAVVAHDPDRLVPVPNLASARLVAAALVAASPPGAPATTAGSDSVPVAVPEAALAAAPRARAVGIPDAPVLPPPGTRVPPVWSVCDTAEPDPASPTPWARPRVRSVVVVADATPGRPLGPAEALLLRDRAGRTWLVHDGVRSRVDPTDPAVVGALGLAGLVPRPATTSLLDALVEGPPLTPPVLAARGTPGPPGMTGTPVGTVLRLAGPGTAERRLVVEASGLQEVPPLVADLVRRSGAAADGAAPADAAMPAVLPGQVAATPVAREIPLGDYPATAPVPVPLPAGPTTCAGARGGGTLAGPAVTGSPPPDGTTLRQADGAGDRVDGAVVPRTGVVVRAVLPGRPDAPGPLAVVSASGTVSAVPDAATAARLGLDGAGAGPVPAAVLDLLPRGPTLSVEAATTPLD